MIHTEEDRQDTLRPGQTDGQTDRQAGREADSLDKPREDTVQLTSQS